MKTLKKSVVVLCFVLQGYEQKKKQNERRDMRKKSSVTWIEGILF